MPRNDPRGRHRARPPTPQRKSNFKWNTTIVLIVGAIFVVSLVGGAYLLLRPVAEVISSSPPTQQTVVALGPKGTIVPEDNKNCGDFFDQEDAQNYYVAQGGPGIDPDHLDQDRDGQACELFDYSGTDKPVAPSTKRVEVHKLGTPDYSKVNTK